MRVAENTARRQEHIIHLSADMTAVCVVKPLWVFSTKLHGTTSMYTKSPKLIPLPIGGNSFYPHSKLKHRVFLKHLCSSTEISGCTCKRQQRNGCRKNHRRHRYGDHWKKGSLYKEKNANCALLRYYTAYSGNSLPTFRNNLSVLSFRVKKFKKKDFFFDSLTYF
jgi:hypothetical protein